VSMGSRPFTFTNNEYYHIYNRGVDGRLIAKDQFDSTRFVKSLVLFNNKLPLGSIYEYERRQTSMFEGQQLNRQFILDKPIVQIICYCLNPNHYHLIVKQIKEGGISYFMQKLGTGITLHFNERHKRRGALFESKFKARPIDDNDYLLHASAYVNLNNRVHRISGKNLELVRSSFDEYKESRKGICAKDIILGQFKGASEYVKFCEESFELMLQAKDDQAELKAIEFEQ